MRKPLLMTFLWVFVVVFAILSYACNQSSDSKSSIESSTTKKESNSFSLKSKTQKNSDSADIRYAQQFEQSLRHVAQKALPSVVSIEVEKKKNFRHPFGWNPFRFFRENDEFFPSSEETLLGSGFFLFLENSNKEKYYIVTNHHVIQEAEKITVRTDDQKTYIAQLVGKDSLSDLAVLSIDRNVNQVEDIIPLKLLSSSNSIKASSIETYSRGANSLAVGDFVIAVGNPFGLSGTFTFGVVSALGRNDIDTTAAFQNWIQIDVAIHPGNSGGPLLNLYGEVVGINTAILSPQGISTGIGFAIPSTLAKGILHQLITKGSVERGYLGVIIQDLRQDDRNTLQFEGNYGVLVREVIEQSPAELAGIQPGDIILSINQKPMQKSADLITYISSLSPGQIVQIQLIQKQQEITLSIPLAIRTSENSSTTQQNQDDPLPSPNLLKEELIWMGISFADLEPYRQLLKIPEQKGVLITEVQESSPARQKASTPLQIGDILQTVGKHPIENLTQLKKLLPQLKEQEEWILVFLRNGKRFWAWIPQELSLEKTK